MDKESAGRRAACAAQVNAHADWVPAMRFQVSVTRGVEAADAPHLGFHGNSVPAYWPEGVRHIRPVLLGPGCQELLMTWLDGSCVRWQEHCLRKPQLRLFGQTATPNRKKRGYRFGPMISYAKAEKANATFTKMLLPVAEHTNVTAEAMRETMAMG